MGFKISLQKKIMLLGLSGTTIVGIFSFFFLFYFFTNMEEIQKNRLFMISDALVDNIQDQFYERYGDVKAFAERFSNENQAKAESENYLNKFSAMNGIYDLILLTDLQGNLIAVNTKDSSGNKINSEQLYSQNFADTAWFKGALNKNYLEDKTKGFEGVHFEEPHFDPSLEKVYGKKIYANIFSTYVYNNKGQPYAIISTHANFIWIESLFIRIYEKLILANLSHAEMNMLDKNGTIIFEYDPTIHDNNKKNIHDENVLNKVNLVEHGNIAAKLLQEGKEGIIEAYNKRKDTMQIVVYNLVNGNKIVNSLGWSILLREDKNVFYSTINKVKYLSIGIFLALVFLMSLISIIFTKSLSFKINSVGQQLSAGSKNLLNSSASLSSASHELSASTTEQASALQETVTAITEISSMLQRTAEMTHKSGESSIRSSQAVDEGKGSLQDMLSAMANIKNSNKDIAIEVENGNKDIAGIIQVIAEIENKTKVINEIVFQTKLLSFNAAVEAARAGEQGKGFAVVAEEVGNLAQMSGNASREISKLLALSTTKVKTIIENTSTQVSAMVQSAADKVQEGEKISLNCVQSFDKISDVSREINSIINEIAAATHEQSKGIQEITQAMHELDSVTHQNSQVAQTTSQSSTELHKQSTLIEVVSESLINLIEGGNTKAIQQNYTQENVVKPKNTIQKIKDTKRQESTSAAKPIENLAKKIQVEQNPQRVPSFDDPRFEEL